LSSCIFFATGVVTASVVTAKGRVGVVTLQLMVPGLEKLGRARPNGL
jgi:hypothetical protein